MSVRSAILVGGGSTRFGGKPKGLAEIGGRRILDRVVDAVVEATGLAPILVGTGKEPGSWRPELEIVGDMRPGTGSLGGIFTALSTQPGPVLCVAWDMPFVPSALLGELIAGSEPFDAFLPESPNRRGVEPLCGVYGPNCRTAIAKQLDAGDLRVIGFLEHVRVGRLPLRQIAHHGNPAMLFMNINTLDDLGEANELWAHHESSQS
jgi:molybdopterin-guanine dinucleotide biosynthesis protein A